MAKSFAVAFLVAVLQLVAAWKEPLPTQCPVKQVVEYQDRFVTATFINTVTEVVPVQHMDVQTFTETLVLTETRFIPTTVTLDAAFAEITDVQIVWTPYIVHQTEVDTFYRTLPETRVTIMTSTATNYLTEYDTITSTLTKYDTVVVQETHTKLHTSYLVQTVPGSTIDVASTVVVTHKPSSTVYITETYTQHLCDGF